MIQLENAYALFLLLLIPLWIVLKKSGILSKVTLPIILSDWDGKIFKWDSKNIKIIQVISNVFFCLGYFCIVIAFSDPKIVHQEKRYISRGTEIVFVIDSSPSMSALDIGNTTRLDAAKGVISKLVTSMSGTSFGIISMASEAACIVPPSTDSDLFLKQLANIRIGELGDGTALGVGISSAVYHLSTSPAPKKIIVLITDGENNAGTIHPTTAAKLAKEQNIPIYVLGIGTQGTVPVEYTDPKTGKVYSGYLESGFNSENLEKISYLSNGRYYDIFNLEDLEVMLKNIIQNETVIPHFYFVPVDNQYYEIFLVISVICFILTWIIKRLYLKEVN